MKQNQFKVLIFFCVLLFGQGGVFGMKKGTLKPGGDSFIHGVLSHNSSKSSVLEDSDFNPENVVLFPQIEKISIKTNGFIRKEKKGAVLFTDLRESTGLGEALKNTPIEVINKGVIVGYTVNKKTGKERPVYEKWCYKLDEETGKQIPIYFSDFIAWFQEFFIKTIVTFYNGEVRNKMGDGAFAFFERSEKISRNQACTNAVHASLALINLLNLIKIRPLEKKKQKDKVWLDCRCGAGIHVGKINSTLNKKGELLVDEGPTINITSRLQDATKIRFSFEGREVAQPIVIISDRVFQALPKCLCRLFHYSFELPLKGVPIQTLHGAKGVEIEFYYEHKKMPALPENKKPAIPRFRKKKQKDLTGDEDTLPDIYTKPSIFINGEKMKFSMRAPAPLLI